MAISDEEKKAGKKKNRKMGKRKKNEKELDTMQRVHESNIASGKKEERKVARRFSERCSRSVTLSDQFVMVCKIVHGNVRSCDVIDDALYL